MDLEHNIPDIISQSKIYHNKDLCKTFYDETKPLCLELDTSGVGLGADLLQTKMAQAVLEQKHQTTTYSGPSYLQARVYQAQRRDTAL